MWERNGVVFPGLGVEAVEEPASSEEGRAEGRTSLVSSLVFPAEAADNGAAFSCVGPAGLRDTVRLEVLYPPAHPQVQHCTGTTLNTQHCAKQTYFALH